MTYGRSPYSDRGRDGGRGSIGSAKNLPASPESKGPFSPLGTGFAPSDGGSASVSRSGEGESNVSTTPVPSPMTTSPRMSFGAGLAQVGAAGASYNYLPSELDSGSNTGRLLHAAVAHFSNALSTHLQLLANSTVELEKRDKEEEKHKGQDQTERVEEQAGKDEASNKGLSRSLNPFHRKKDRKVRGRRQGNAFESFTRGRNWPQHCKLYP